MNFQPEAIAGVLSGPEVTPIHRYSPACSRSEDPAGRPDSRRIPGPSVTPAGPVAGCRRIDGPAAVVTGLPAGCREDLLKRQPYHGRGPPSTTATTGRLPQRTPPPPQNNARFSGTATLPHSNPRYSGTPPTQHINNPRYSTITSDPEVSIF